MICSVRVTGRVQGVGFRPFVYRLARELGVCGWVRNDPDGVSIRASAEEAVLEAFLARLKSDAPRQSRVESVSVSERTSGGLPPDVGFSIIPSDAAGRRQTRLPPDLSVCDECLAELRNPADRRFAYPFINCINCGPRYSIIESLPYDRPNTTMKVFAMCADCRSEYEDPGSRRFHAQPIACPRCGPQIKLLDAAGQVIAGQDTALRAASAALRAGRILAFKGLGGYQLLVDARNDKAVAELRKRKHREEKPFALMYGSLESLCRDCRCSPLEEGLLGSIERPIVLLPRLEVSGSGLSPLIAPGNPWLGAMLPCTPLHILLFDELDFPLVATSGNISDEPICTDDDEALSRLGGIADLFLVHNRPIATYVDDSVLRVIAGKASLLRLARGFAPSYFKLPLHSPGIMGAGAHLKSTIAVSSGSEAVLSQHIGDLESEEAQRGYAKVAENLQGLYQVIPSLVACDVHPDYASSRFALASKARFEVQHHYAHVLSCMLEHRLQQPVLGIAWDGTGLGTDGTIWGGEFLRVSDQGFERVAHLRPFRLPGGESAIKHVDRIAYSLLRDSFGQDFEKECGDWLTERFESKERANLEIMLAGDISSPFCSSMGRLFDGVAAIAGVCHEARFDAQPAMMLEFAVGQAMLAGTYETELSPAGLSGSETLLLEWSPLVRAVFHDARNGLSKALISAKFHHAMADAALAVCNFVRMRFGEKQVALAGGCFQNKYLTEAMLSRLQAAGFSVYHQCRIPTNDNGISLGQLYAALRQSAQDDKSFRRELI